MTSKETAVSFMERMLAVHTVTTANEDTAATVVETDPLAFHKKPQAVLESPINCCPTGEVRSTANLQISVS